MGEISQENAPIYEALERLRKMRVVPFDVPGHKRGRGNPELARSMLSKESVLYEQEVGIWVKYPRKTPRFTRHWKD